MAAKLEFLTKLLKNPLMSLNASATEEYSELPGQRKEQTCPLCNNLIFKRTGYWEEYKYKENKTFWTYKTAWLSGDHFGGRGTR